jgi:hypothetical protein
VELDERITEYLSGPLTPAEVRSVANQECTDLLRESRDLIERTYYMLEIAGVSREKGGPLSNCVGILIMRHDAILRHFARAAEIIKAHPSPEGDEFIATFGPIPKPSLG